MSEFFRLEQTSKLQAEASNILSNVALGINSISVKTPFLFLKTPSSVITISIPVPVRGYVHLSTTLGPDFHL